MASPSKRRACKRKSKLKDVDDVQSFSGLRCKAQISRVPFVGNSAHFVQNVLFRIFIKKFSSIEYWYRFLRNI